MLRNTNAEQRYDSQNSRFWVKDMRRTRRRRTTVILASRAAPHRGGFGLKNAHNSRPSTILVKMIFSQIFQLCGIQLKYFCCQSYFSWFGRPFYSKSWKRKKNQNLIFLSLFLRKKPKICLKLSPKPLDTSNWWY